MTVEQWIRVGITEHGGSIEQRNRCYTAFWIASAKLRSRKKPVGGGKSHSVTISWSSWDDRFPLLNKEVEPTFEDGAEIKVLLSTETRPGAINADAALLAYEVSPGVWVPNAK